MIEFIARFLGRRTSTELADAPRMTRVIFVAMMPSQVPCYMLVGPAHTVIRLVLALLLLN